MALSFPTNPQIGDVYNSGNMSYQWDGTSWAATGASVDLTPKSLGEVATSFDQSNTALIIANTANTTAANVQFRRVSTIAELKTLTPIANMTVQVDGYYTKGDGGGGEFWGNTTSGTHTDNGGTIITSNVIGGTASSSWRRIVDDSLNIRWFGAKSNLSFDSTTYIQAAIDSVKPENGGFPTIAGTIVTVPRQIYVPSGSYAITAPLKLYSFQTLKGDNESSYIVTDSSFSGTEMVTLSASATPTERCFGAVIESLTFKSTISNMQVARTPNNVMCLNSTFRNLWLLTERGFNFDFYAQNVLMEHIYSKGNLDQMLFLVGNSNVIKDIMVDSGTSATTDPIIHVTAQPGGSPTSDLIMDHIIIEHTMNATKTPIVIEGSNGAYLSNYWCETALDNGYILEANNSTVVLKDWMPGRVSTRGMIKANNKSIIMIDRFSTDAATTAWWNWFDVDSTSMIDIGYVAERYGAEQYLLDLSKNLRARTFYPSTQQTSPIANVSMQSSPRYINGQNLFVNPSFEAGSYGWTFSATPSVANFIDSDVNTGLMAEYGWSGTSCQIYQNIVVSANNVGKPITVSGMAKLVNGGTMYVMGASIYNTSPFRAAANTGWNLMTATFYPTQPGTYGFGIYASGMTGGVSRLYLDDLSVSFSEETMTNSSKFSSLDVNGRTWAVAAAAPTTGTWKVGDMVYNNAPAAGGKIGWVCTVAGTPGTWKAWGVIDP